MTKFKNILLICAALILLTASKSNAWDTTAAKFYPLKTGNVYVFHKYELILGCSPQIFQAIKKVEIHELTLKNGKRYFRFSGWWNDFPAQPAWNYQRIDSNSMNVYLYDSLTNTELLIDSLMASLGDMFNSNRLTSVSPKGIYDFEFQENFLGSSRNIRQFQCSPWLVSN
ncbi:MAG: hypothetical protein ABI462_12095, partial [Ignavibacteria bacterium]